MADTIECVESPKPALRLDLVTLQETAPGHFTVRIGDRYADHLTRDEALWTIAAWIVDGSSWRWLKTEEQHAHYATYLEKMRRERQGESTQ